MAIVQTNINYTYEIMRSDIYKLNITYAFLQVQNIGFSVLGKQLPIIRLGRGSKEVFYSASFHANEWITSVILMKFIEDYCIAYTNNTSLFGYNVRNIFNNISIYIMPMVNPDGVNLVTGAYNTNSNIYRSFQSISNAYTNIPFPNGWKANFNGVDLNLQFPARMGTSKRNKIFSRIYFSGSKRFCRIWSFDRTRIFSYL
jgi:g-D-glutamyl-meso-diaminopimelate peptidase